MEETTFQDLNVKPWLIRQCRALGIKTPTPVQRHCIPEILKGRDCVGVAQTGSGKTMAFALPILQNLSEDPYGIYALILTPTRELAFQIADQFRVLGKPLSIKDCVVVGGRDMVRQGQELASSPHIVIATPGRLADHLRSCDTFSLKRIRYLVLDEADRLLEEGGGFDQQLSNIFQSLPEKRQTLLFTATITDCIRDVANGKDRFFWESSEPRKTVDTLDQRYVLTPNDFRDAYLIGVLLKCRERNPNGSCIVFARTCRIVQLLSMTLTELGFPNVSLHSMKPQRERMSSLSEFKSNRIRTLIATDVASRGLDIPEVEFVINHNVPTKKEDYVHRVGRTARAGRDGLAITLVTPHDVLLIESIEEKIKTRLTEFEVDEEKIGQVMTQVNVTRREQDIKLTERDFDERRQLHKRKKLMENGLDPDQVEIEKRKRRRELRKEHRKRILSERQKGEKPTK